MKEKRKFTLKDWKRTRNLFNLALKLRLVDLLNYNFEGDWLIELTVNKLSNGNLASKLM